MSFIKITITDAIADVRINRPEKMNAIAPEMWTQLADAPTELAGTKGVRAIILSGEGAAFCAGIDVSSFAGSGISSLIPRTRGISNDVQAAAIAWREIDIPVIAAIHGVAFGAGLQIALGADMRYASRDARFSLMEGRWGLTPDIGAYVTMRNILRDDIARDLIYTARIIDAQEALSIGLVTALHDDPYAAALEKARAIAANSPDAVRASKRLMRLAADADAASILLAESEEQDALAKTENHKEALYAGLQKRTPNYKD